MNADFPSAAGNAGTAAALRTAPQQGISIQCHENDVPPFVEAALLRLYSNLFSSLAFWRVHGGADNASTYVVREEEKIVTVWLFRRDKNRVHVVNEGMALGSDEVARFAGYIFSRYPVVDLISFHAVQAKVQHLPLPYQRYNCLEDMVLTLPSSPEEYLASLGKSTRSYVQRYLKKLRRDFPSFQFRWCGPEEIEEAQLQQIVMLNRSRMADKGKISINDDAAAQRVAQLAMECGAIGIISLDGVIVAGTINYRVGNNYFLDILAHDPNYNGYRVGTLCCYLTICACIDGGGSEYHFLWGMDEYKSHLLGVRRDLDDLSVYRSRTRMLLNGSTVLINISAAAKRRARLWLRQARKDDRPIARLLTWGVRTIRNKL